MLMGIKDFVEKYKDCSYEQLVKVREELLSKIRQYESKERNGGYSVNRKEITPAPELCYEMNLEYLQEIIKLMKEKYTVNALLLAQDNESGQLNFIRNVIWSPESVDENSLKLAKQLLEKLIKAGNVEAMNLKGAMFFEGRMETEDKKKALYWYKKSAEAGDSLAMSNLGYAYFYGFGTKVNMQLAYKYFSMAAQRDEWDAIIKLGDMYLNGLYVIKDESMAWNLYNRCYKIVPHDSSNDAYPACLIRMAEFIFNHETGNLDSIELAYQYLMEAYGILSLQIKDGNYYAKKRIEQVEKDVKDIKKCIRRLRDAQKVLYPED